mmetsp:Transcript_15553/g.33473  ORF Transcript_15553/g.33473 Transcript_15553/m.33473 type:complete len:731 (-) Transcript_15553:467-2659(-)
MCHSQLMVVASLHVTQWLLLASVSISIATSSSTLEAVEDAHNQSTKFTTNTGTEYYFKIMEQYDAFEDQNDNLIHIPLRSRVSVLRERNLLHLLEEEREDDVATTFTKWAANYNYKHDDDGRLLRQRQTSSSSYADAEVNTTSLSGDELEGMVGVEEDRSMSRVLQEFSGEGTHFVDAFIGTPAQKRVLAVSSGADFTAFPCDGCTKCGPIISKFKQTSSTSFVTMPCGRCVGGQREDVCDDNREKCIARGYNLVDKSAWTAYEARDNIYVGGAEEELAKMNLKDPSDLTGTNVPKQHGFPLVFACQTEATGWYASEVQDGVIGFSTARTSFVNQMVFQDQLKYPRFCMCFEQKLLMGDDYRNAGLVTLGGYNPHILDAPLVYVHNIKGDGETRYKVHVRSIYLREGGGQSIVPDRENQAVVRLSLDQEKFNEKNGGTILDSGVPLLIFDESLQESFLAEWKKMVGTEFTFGKMLITENDVKALPTLIFQIKAHDGVDKSFNPRTVPNMAGDRDPQNPFDALLAIPATHYMEYNPSTGTYRAKINLFSKMGSFLGINAMQGHAFFYDLAKDRIGFAESYNCRPKMNPGGFVDDDMFELPSVQIQTGTGPGGPNGPFGDGGMPDGGMPDGPSVDGPNSRGPGGSAARGEDMGTCVTATCISFVTVGYCIVVIALAVAYKKYKPKDRSKQFDREMDEGDDVFDDQTEVLNPAFEQHMRNTGGVSVRGSAVMA